MLLSFGIIIRFITLIHMCHLLLGGTFSTSNHITYLEKHIFLCHLNKYVFLNKLNFLVTSKNVLLKLKIDQIIKEEIVYLYWITNNLFIYI